jgi:hypothetical protein
MNNKGEKVTDALYELCKDNVVIHIMFVLVTDAHCIKDS